MFYTHTCLDKDGNTVLVRGYDEQGKGFSRQEKYKPYLFVSSNKPERYRTIHGNNVRKVEFDSIREARKFVNRYRDVDNFPIYGLEKFEYTYLNDTYPGAINYDFSFLRVLNIDIECEVTTGFPDPFKAENTVTLVTMSMKGKRYTLGLGDFKTDDKSIKYVKCANEASLLKGFVVLWESLNPDIVTGWNISLFDIPYLVNRILKVLGEGYAERLSPWHQMVKRKITVRKKEKEVIEPKGVEIVDYLDLYKKFTQNGTESYALDHISKVEELGFGKLDYSEYQGLEDLRLRNHQKYVEYNIRDTEVVEALDAKVKFMELVVSMAYLMKCNYTDIYGTVKPWDIAIHNFLLTRNQVIEPKPEYGDDEKIQGGFVMETQPGKFFWVVSFDAKALYPSTIRQYNISPEAFRGKLPEIDFDRLVAGQFDNAEYVRRNVTVTANGLMFDRDKQGFYGEIMEHYAGLRDKYKKLMLEYEAEYEKTEDVKFKNLHAKFDHLQTAIKLAMNSFYGMLLEKSCRWFDKDFGAAITSCGRLAINWAATRINKWLNEVMGDTKDRVIAGDTDSMYLNMEDVVRRFFAGLSQDEQLEGLKKFCKDKIEPFLRECFDEMFSLMNAREKLTIMKLEKFSDTAIFVGKKNYVLSVLESEGVRYKEPKIVMKGIKAVKSDTPASCKEVIKDCIKIALHGEEKQLQQKVADFYKKFLTFDYEDAAFPRGVNNLANYSDSVQIYKKGSPIHVKASLIYNEYVKRKGLDKKLELIYEGDKIRFAYLRPNNPLGAAVIATPGALPKELGLEDFIDTETQWQKCFISTLSKITDVVGWNCEPISTLERFFS